jgi:hypothetical protein
MSIPGCTSRLTTLNVARFRTPLFVCVHGSPSTQVQVTTSEYSTLDHFSDWVYNRGHHLITMIERVIVTRITATGQMCVSRGVGGGQ